MQVSRDLRISSETRNISMIEMGNTALENFGYNTDLNEHFDAT